MNKIIKYASPPTAGTLYAIGLKFAGHTPYKKSYRKNT
jgi:hypothetical protein